MTGDKIRVRASRSAGELEIEGPPELVKEWWDRVWPQMGTGAMPVPQASGGRVPPSMPTTPAVFGEYYNEFRSDITDVDRVLVAGAFVQLQDEDRTFTTKAANQLLLDQNTKIGNASESVRRLIASKRAFVVSDGRFRVSANGFEHLKTLKATS